MWCRHWRLLGAACLAAWMAACSAKEAPSVPSVLAHPEFVYPSVPESLDALDPARRVDRGWRFLQNGDTVGAAHEFQTALKGAPALYPAGVGLAYVALAGRDDEQSLRLFDEALRASPSYVPGLVGRGQALLRLERHAEALEAYDAALAADASLAEVRRTADLLRFRAMQDLIEAARAASSSGRLDEARSAYVRALDLSPDSAFLHRELGVLERRLGDPSAALDRFQRAATLDPGDAVSALQIGEVLEEQGDYTAAEAAYQRVAEIEPNGELKARIERVSSKAREARLPEEFRAIASAKQITRGDLAALVGVRLEDILRTPSAVNVVMTDTRGHWAASWIGQVARAGVLVPFANHTFQPNAGVTRADVASAVSRVVQLLAAERPALRAHLRAQPRMTDLSVGHLSYQDIAVSVASGVMPLIDGDRFHAAQPVSGAEAEDVVARLRALIGSR